MAYRAEQRGIISKGVNGPPTHSSSRRGPGESFQV